MGDENERPAFYIRLYISYPCSSGLYRNSGHASRHGSGLRAGAVGRRAAERQVPLLRRHALLPRTPAGTLNVKQVSSVLPFSYLTHLIGC